MVGRLGAAGDNCSLNIAPVRYRNDEFEADGRTYEDDASLMSTFIGVQCVLLLLQIFICWIPCYTTPEIFDDKDYKDIISPRKQMNSSAPTSTQDPIDPKFKAQTSVVEMPQTNIDVSDMTESMQQR